MTPLKHILLDGVGVLTEDHAGFITLVCVAEDEKLARWIVDSLHGYHKVPVLRVEVEGRGYSVVEKLHS